MKTKILIIAGYSGNNTTGGSSKSLTNIVNSLRGANNVQIKTLKQKFSNKLLRSFGFESYVLIPKIVKNILRFKPNVIITQDSMAFPTILVSKITKIPVIHIIRSTVDFCPKYVDITEYGQSCYGIYSRKQCFDCVNKWRTLRILIGNRPKGSEHSIRTSLVSVLYKLRYFVCSFNLYLIKKANINLVASDLMKEYFFMINQDKFKVVNITPICRQTIEIEPKGTHFVFIRTDYETSHKGFDFIKKLSKLIPKRYWILVIGGNNVGFKKEEDYPHIINIGRLSSELLGEVLSDSAITLVPSFSTEAFGRVIVESIMNKTLVISSPNCGANYYFKDRDFIKIVPLKTSLGIKAIKETLQNPYQITDEDVNLIYEPFSMQKGKEDFIALIQDIIK